MELAYATTAHRAQGSTVETAHAVVAGPSMTREVLYVALTRGRASNHAYVTTDLADDEGHLHGDGEPATARSVLTTILRREGAVLSAHETAASEADRLGTIGRLAAEYDTIHRAAQADRHAALIDACGLDVDEVTTSPHYPSLAAAIHRADAYDLDPAAALPSLTRAQPIDTEEDPAQILAARLSRWTDHTLAAAPQTRRPRRLVAGLVPAAQTVTDPDLARALSEREQLLEQRAHDLAQTAIRTRAAWLRDLGTRPADPDAAATWERCVAVVAAYRERWEVTHSGDPLGQPTSNWTHRHDHRHAGQAVEAARRLAGQATDTATTGPTVDQQPRRTGPAL